MLMMYKCTRRMCKHFLLQIQYNVVDILDFVGCIDTVHLCTGIAHFPACNQLSQNDNTIYHHASTYINSNPKSLHRSTEKTAKLQVTLWKETKGQNVTGKPAANSPGMSPFQWLEVQCFFQSYHAFLSCQKKTQMKVRAHRKLSQYTLQGTNISHLSKRNVIFKTALVGDMLVPRRVSPCELGHPPVHSFCSNYSLKNLT